MITLGLFLYKNIIWGVVGNFAYDESKNLLNLFNVARKRISLILKLIKIIRRFLKEHNCDTKVMKSVIKDTEVIKNMFDHVSGRDVTASKDKTISEYATCVAKKLCENEISVSTEAVSKLLADIYIEIQRYYESKLTKNQQFLAGLIENSREASSERSDNILEILVSRAEITDEGVLWGIYRSISNNIINYESQEVSNILPLIKGKSDVLYDVLVCLNEEMINGFISQSRLQQLIESKVMTKIKLDVLSKIVYFSSAFGNIKLVSSIPNVEEHFDNILLCLRENRLHDLYSVSEESIDGVKYISYEINDTDDECSWLYKRLCVLSILQSEVWNGSECVNTLLGDDLTPVDNILIFERKAREYFNKVNLRREDAETLMSDYQKIELIILNMPISMQVKYFETKIRLSLVVSIDQAASIIETLPENLSDIPEIEMLRMQVLIDNKTSDIDLDYLMDLCIKHNEFWLINNYLIDIANSDPDNAKAFLEKYSFVCDRDVNVFLIYVQLVAKIESSSKAQEILIKYEGKYGKHLEYWIDRIRIVGQESDIKSVMDYWSNNYLEIRSREAVTEFIKILHKYGEYSFIVSILEKGYYKNNLTPELMYWKAISLLELGDELKAFDVMLQIPSDFKLYDSILRNLLVIAINNKRSVTNSILERASQSDVAAVLSLVALYYENEGKYNQAKEHIIKALLRSNDCNDLAFGTYFAIYKIGGEEEDVDVETTNKGTCVHLVDSECGKEIVFCIQEFNVIPGADYIWEDAIHITVEEAVKIKLFRKKKGDLIVIGGREYKISKLESLYTYFFRVCSNKLIERGDVKVITLPIDNDGQLDREKMVEVIKEYIGDDEAKMMWLEQYKDLSAMPVSLFMSVKYTNATYSQLVSAVIEEKDIYFRESPYPFEYGEKSFILSFSSLVALAKLGYDEIKTDSSIIAESTSKIIDSECNHIIFDSNREHVATMGVQGDELYFLECTEEDKSKRMEEVVDIKALKNKYMTKENSYSVDFNNIDELNIKELLGIADFDTLAIAKNEGLVVVSSEIPLSAIATTKQVDVIAVPLMDYIADTCNSVDALIETIKKAIRYKFLLPITTKVVGRISDEYDAANDEKKRNIVDRCAEITQLDFSDIEYQDHVGQTIGQILHERNKERCNSDVDKIFAMMSCCLRGFKVSVEIDENGTIITSVVDRNGNLIS